MASSSSSQSAQVTVSDEHDQRETKRMKGEPKVSSDASEGSMEGRPWTQMEDIKLLKHVVVHGGRKWRKLSLQLHGRSPDSCKARWFNKWNPHLERRFGADAERYLVKPEDDDHARKQATGDSSAGTDVQSDSTVVASMHESDLSLSSMTDNSSEIDPVGKSMSKGPSDHGFKQNILMANCPTFKRTIGTGGLMAEGDKDMASKHDEDPSSPAAVFPLMGYNPIDNDQQPPSTPKFIDFLGVGSV